MYLLYTWLIIYGDYLRRYWVNEIIVEIEWQKPEENTYREVIHILQFCKVKALNQY